VFPGSEEWCHGTLVKRYDHLREIS
jgi:hypothetical protein